MENREHRRLVLMKYCNKYLSQSNIIMKPFIRTCLNKLERKQTLKKKDINKLSQLLTFDLKMSRDQIGEYFKPLTIELVEPTSNDLTQFFK